MIKYLTNLLIIIAFLGMSSTILSSCSQDDNDDSPYVGPDVPQDSDSEFDSTILIYAVATNSLQGNLVIDKAEMLQAAPNIDLDKNNVIIFQTSYKLNEENTAYVNEGEVSLIRLVKEGNDYAWETLKQYSQDIASLNPRRMEEVVNYVIETYPSKTYGMMFWSHSTGAQPYITTKSSMIESPMVYSFGQDKTTPETDYQEMNIDQLANALPDNKFRFIWFDSCYMSNIESIYQLRNKCEVYVGYATEVCNEGLPYHKVLPYLTSTDPDILAAASAFFDFYDTEYRYRIATIAATDMSKIELLAEYCRRVYSHDNLSSLNGLHVYTRLRTTSGPFYDLGDYTKALAALNGMEVTDEEWNNLLSQCLIYKAATPYDFNNLAIDPVRYSGISTHVYDFDTDSKAEEYYKSLDWYQSVFQ